MGTNNTNRLELMDWTIKLTVDSSAIPDDTTTDELIEDLEDAIQDFRYAASKLFIKHDVDSARINIS